MRDRKALQRVQRSARIPEDTGRISSRNSQEDSEKIHRPKNNWPEKKAAQELGLLAFKQVGCLCDSVVRKILRGNKQLYPTLLIDWPTPPKPSSKPSKMLWKNRSPEIRVQRCFTAWRQGNLPSYQQWNGDHRQVGLILKKCQITLEKSRTDCGKCQWSQEK